MNPGTVQLQSTTGRSGLVIDIYHGPYYLHFGLYTFFCHAFFPHCPLWKKTQKAWEKRKYLFYFWIVKSWRSSNCTICNLEIITEYIYIYIYISNVVNSKVVVGKKYILDWRNLKFIIREKIHFRLDQYDKVIIWTFFIYIERWRIVRVYQIIQKVFWSFYN